MQWWSMRCLYKTFVKRLVSYNDTSQVKTCKWLFREHYPSGGKYYPWGRNFAVKWTLGSKDILIVAWKINFENREERTFVQRQENATKPFMRSGSKQKREKPFVLFLPCSDLWETFGWKVHGMFSKVENEVLMNN